MKASLVAFGVLALVLVSAIGASDFDDDRLQVLHEHKAEFKTWLLSGFYGNSRKSGRSPITCALCETALSVVLDWIRQGQTVDEISNSTIALCKSLNIVDEEVCEMIVPLYVDPVYFMATDHHWLTVFDLCGLVLGSDLLPGCFYMNNTMTDWVIDVDYQMRPPVIEHPLIPADVPTVKVIHLTDIHPDLHYAEGSLTDCGKPMCCRPDIRDDPSNSSISAGPWGDFNCDFPISSTHNVFLDAAIRHPDAEFVLSTGDLVHHQIWNTTIEDNRNHYAAYMNAITNAFTETPIYPAIGNHEPHPCNMFAPEHVWDKYDMTWLYGFQADLYRNYLTPQALATFRTKGYYTQLHKPGFRIVTLNTNFCYTFNFWIVYDAVDPEGQLQWFSDVMYDAERAGEKVWVVGHVPPGGDDCWNKWSLQFLRVINRYQNIILAQFYGHTHNDEFKVFFDDSKNPPEPSGSLYIGASVTPYTNLNPGYKVFYADGVRPEATWQIVDHETYVYDLVAANAAGPNVDPIFYKEYSAKEAYGLEGLRPVDLFDFVKRMAVDDGLFLTYYRHWYKDSGKEAEDSDCPSTGDVSECKFDILCGIVNTDYTNRHCDMIKAFARNYQK